MKTVFIGFDSAWANNPKAPGAICSVSFDGKRFSDFEKPELAGFDEARTFITDVSQKHRLTIIAIDQPTIVKNATGSRPAERVASSFIGWLGGGVQPANRSNKRMFGTSAPIRKLKKSVDAEENPDRSRHAKSGKFIMEVFPSLALPALNRAFYGRGKHQKYNPARRTFKRAHWRAVVATVKAEARAWRCVELAGWCTRLEQVKTPQKYHQDKLDAAICLLIAIRWHRGSRKHSVMIGDLKSGYIVAPVVPETRRRLHKAAFKRGVALDGAVPTSK